MKIGNESYPTGKKTREKPIFNQTKKSGSRPRGKMSKRMT